MVEKRMEFAEGVVLPTQIVGLTSCGQDGSGTQRRRVVESTGLWGFGHWHWHWAFLILGGSWGNQCGATGEEGVFLQCTWQPAVWRLAQRRELGGERVEPVCSLHP
jgi:hypothetical protein